MQPPNSFDVEMFAKLTLDFTDLLAVSCCNIVSSTYTPTYAVSPPVARYIHGSAVVRIKPR